jgi:hypothetical protein
MSMNGNPHYGLAAHVIDKVDALPGGYSRDQAMLKGILGAQAQATLALAFEQRTANLIALHQMAVTAIQNGADNDGISPDDFRRSSDEIETRLGLNGDTE